MYLFLVFIILCLLELNLFIRNEYVYEFKVKILNDVYRPKQNANLSEDNLKIADAIIEKLIRDQMLFSFKPLKLKYWFTDEEIDFINNQAKKN